MADEATSITAEELLAHSGWARRLAQSLLGDPAAADDVVQESWLAALDTRQPIGRLRPFLSSVVRHRALSWKRSERSRARRELASSRREVVADAEVLERAELRRSLMDEVLALPEPYRSTILLRYFEELPLVEIAHRRGLPSATVRSHLARGIERLRSRFDERGRRDGRDWLHALVPLASHELASPAGTGAVLAATSAGGAKLASLAALAGALIVAAFLGWQALRPSGPATAPVEAAPVAMERPDRDREETIDAPAGVEAARTVVADQPRASSQNTAPIVTGVVRAAGGGPVAGARVLVAKGEAYNDGRVDTVLYDGPDAPAPRFEATTDASGRFSLSGPDAGRLRVAVRAAGFAPLDDDERYLPPSGTDLGTFTLNPGLQLAGTVVDRDGRPVPNANIFRKDTKADAMGFGSRSGGKAERALLTTTDENGAFRADPLAPGPWQLRVEHDDHAHRTFNGEAYEPGLSSGHVLQLFPSTSVTGRLVTPPGRDLHFDAFKVSLQFGRDQEALEEAEQDHRYKTLRVAEDGTFEFKGVRTRDEPPLYKLSAYRVYGNLVRYMSEPLVVEAGARDVEVLLQPYAQVAFQLVDAEDGTPLDDPQVYLVIEGNNHIDVNESETLARVGPGAYRIVEISNRNETSKVGVRARVPGYQDRVVMDVELRSGEEVDLGTLELVRAPTLVVTAKDGKRGHRSRASRSRPARRASPICPNGRRRTATRRTRTRAPGGRRTTTVWRR